MQNLSAVLAELERWHGIFNRELFVGRLSGRVVITVQTTGRRRSLLGWHWASRWQNGKKALAEINVVAESLRRPPNEILETLLHEMAHQKNSEAGICDVSTGTQYHNRRFKDAAEAVGLECQSVGRFGWAHTKLTEKALAVIRRHKPDAGVFSIVRVPEPRREKAPTKLVKWVCDCGFGVRVAIADFDATCNACGEDFRIED